MHTKYCEPGLSPIGVQAGEKMCKQYVSSLDKTPPVVTNRDLGTLAADPHDCGKVVTISPLAYSDCSNVTQSYSFKYIDPATGTIRISDGPLTGDTRVVLTAGYDTIFVTVVDDCNNRTIGRYTAVVIDKTPPTPVCKEYTQVTVDPTSCWSSVAAIDLDNGSHDNCV